MVFVLLCVLFFGAVAVRNGLFCFAFFDVWIHPLEERPTHAESYGVFFVDSYFFAGAGVASVAGFLGFQVDGAEVANLEATAADEMFGNLGEDHVGCFRDVLSAEGLPALIEILDEVGFLEGCLLHGRISVRNCVRAFVFVPLFRGGCFGVIVRGLDRCRTLCRTLCRAPVVMCRFTTKRFVKTTVLLPVLYKK